MGPLIPLFWTSGDVCSGFQSQSGQPYLRLAEAYVLHVLFTEILQGNQANRMVMLNNKVVDYANIILRADNFSSCQVDQVHLCIVHPERILVVTIFKTYFHEIILIVL